MGKVNTSIKLKADVLKLSNGKFMNVKFIKRSDGTLRSMNCRLGTTKGTTGGKKTTSVETNGVLTVREVGIGNIDKFRNIALENIVSARIKGVTFKF